jgi:hypothetical protein
MMRPELIQRAQTYCQRNSLTLRQRLGFGVHGIVFSAQGHAERGQSAVKAHEHEAAYRRERDVYLRLQEYEVRRIGGCAVPQLVHYDDALWVIEMTVVTRPFVLDFAGAYLDWGPEFSDEVLADWLAEKQEQFESRWPAVEAILRELEGYGVFVIDVTPNNIALAD